jgi:hypothetical protein
MFNKKRLLFIVILGFLFALIYFNINQEHQQSDLKVVSVKIPALLYGMVNQDSYPGTEVLYVFSDDLGLELTFNYPITKNDNYNFYFFQDSNFIPIGSVDNASDQYYFFYEIKENKIKIYGKNNIFPSGFVILNIPGEIEAINKGKLKNDNKIVLSPNKLTPHLQLDWLNKVERNDFFTIVLPKLKNDNQKIGYIKNNNIPFFKNKGSQETWFDLFRGESVLVLSEEDDLARIAVYTSKGIIDRIIGSDEDIFTDKYTTSFIGYVPRTEISIIPEPLNEGTIYAMYRSDDMISEDIEFEAHLVILTPLIGSYSIYFPSGLEPLEENHYHAVESIALWKWVSMLPGGSYWTTYADDHGNWLSKYDPRSHLPQYYWTKEEYNKYNVARKEYISFLEKQFKGYRVLAEYVDFKESIYPLSFNKRARLEDLWRDWGFYDKDLSSDWFFREILRRFEFTAQRTIVNSFF